MEKDERDLLEVLKFELQFLEKGGYGRSPREAWRPSYIFEDSPTCMNYDSKENPGPCADCVLMHLVPPEARSAQIPCRHIPLNNSGITLDTLYQRGDQYEIEEKMRQWLKATIERLEKERAVAREVQQKQPPPTTVPQEGIPLYQKQHPKCANPACPTEFHWTGGGKFFRFRPEAANPPGTTGVRHYWLCENCSRVFTLVHDEERGVLLNALWPELPDSAAKRAVRA
jgi:hypothetical protein